MKRITTLDERKEEFLKCKLSFNYTFKNYFYKVNKNLSNITHDDYLLLESFQNNDKILLENEDSTILNEIICAYFAWLLIFNDNIKLVLFKNTLGESKKNLNKIILYLETLPMFIFNIEDYIKKTEVEIVLINGNKITVGAGSKHPLHAVDCNMIYIQDLANYTYIEDFCVEVKYELKRIKKKIIINTNKAKRYEDDLILNNIKDFLNQNYK